MRSDLNKLLCEHERHNSHEKYGEFRRQNRNANPKNIGDECENLRMTEGMKRRHHTRSFGENLNPLIGFIRKNVGRPWDKAYSELCQTFDKTSVINQHIIQHLFDYVDITVVEKDGVLYHRRWRGELEPLSDGYGGSEYFVHPRTGILLKNKHYLTYSQYRRKRDLENKKKEEESNRKISANVMARRREDSGLWYICTYSPIPQYCYEVQWGPKGERLPELQQVAGRARDLWTGNDTYYSSNNTWRYYGPDIPKEMERNVYCSHVKQANSKEIKKYKLNK